MLPKVSIIIPCREIDALALECIEKCNELDYPDLEVIVLPDCDSSVNVKARIISTGNASPGRKRNTGVINSSGELLAFIDSDAYPRGDWLKNALEYFSDPHIGAVGGPGVTPESDSILQKAGGYVLSSILVGGLANRYDAKLAIESDDIHSCNFITRRAVFERIKWDEKYWPGEDTLISLGIKRMGLKMIESPEVVVYHHRRPLFMQHLKQVSRFGLHRGFFAKRFPETSLRATYFLPSFLVLFIFFGLLFSLVDGFIMLLYISLLLLYLIAALGVSANVVIKTRNLKFTPLILFGTIATHICYGVNFLRGLLIPELER